MQASDVVAASSVVIAVLALAVSVYQSMLTRRHHRQSVQPALQLHIRLRTGEKAGLRLVNVDLGPALITRWSCSSVPMSVMGESIDARPVAFA